MLNARAWNIALRTAHIAAMGVLVGGHAFDVGKSDLLVAFWLTMGSGIALAVVEVGPSLVWFHQGRGLMTMAKLALLCAVPFLWDFWSARLTVVLAVVVLASVGSHMPARLRYYSVIYRTVLRCNGGPGSARLAADMNNSEEE